jgi:dTMP kinase
MQLRRERQKFERLEFLRLVDDNFRRMAALEPERFVQIDAEKDKDDVADDAMDAILKLMGK